MFEVMYNDEFCKVYSIRDNGADFPPDFLIYFNYHWVWISSVRCIPTK